MGVVLCLGFVVQQFMGPLHMLAHEHVLAAHVAHLQGDLRDVQDCHDEGHQPSPAIEHAEVGRETALSSLRLGSEVNLVAPERAASLHALVVCTAPRAPCVGPLPTSVRSRSGPRAPPFAL